jgi:hypothetical protein
VIFSKNYIYKPESLNNKELIGLVGGIMRKIVVIMLILLVVVVGLVGCSNKNVATVAKGDGLTNDGSQGKNNVNTAKLSADEKFAAFGADVVCARLEYTDSLREVNKDNSDFMDKMTKLREEYNKATVAISEKYGYKEGETDSLSQKYYEDIPYAEAVIKRVKKLCPRAAPELEENIGIMKEGMYVKVIINEAADSSIIEYKYFEDGYINSGSRDSSADMDDIHDAIREKFGEELADKAIAAATYVYE